MPAETKTGGTKPQERRLERGNCTYHGVAVQYHGYRAHLEQLGAFLWEGGLVMYRFPDMYGNHERHPEKENYERVRMANARAWWLTFPEEERLEVELLCAQVSPDLPELLDIVISTTFWHQVHPLRFFDESVRPFDPASYPGERIKRR